MPEAIPNSIHSIEEFPKLRVVHLKGALDREVIPDIVKFKDKTRAEARFEYKNMLFDFEKVDSIDSAAVAETILIFSEIKESHHKMGTIHLKQVFRDEFRILKVDQFISEYRTLAEAIRVLTA